MDAVVGGVVQRTYQYGLERISQAQVTSGTTSYYGYDAHGDVRFLADSTSKVTDTYDYDAFGNIVGSTGTTPNVYRYQGEALDAETGLYYLRARYYDPVAGRFLNVDPMADQGEHPYSYAAADPVNGHDPTGQQEVLESSFAMAVILPSAKQIMGAVAHIRCIWGVTSSMLAVAGQIIHGVSACQVGGTMGGGAGGGRGGGGGGGGAAGGPNQSPKIGIGVEVPAPAAVQNGVPNLAVDTGHTIVYFKDAPGTVVSLLSFGPGGGGISGLNVNQFLKGNLPGDVHWPITGTLSTWESYITPAQLSLGERCDCRRKRKCPDGGDELPRQRLRRGRGMLRACYQINQGQCESWARKTPTGHIRCKHPERSRSETTRRRLGSGGRRDGMGRASHRILRPESTPPGPNCSGKCSDSTSKKVATVHK